MTADWWKEAVVYQIYPASFNDSNNDGFGDINGITQKLDYLCSLGVRIIWISPYFKSPYIDNGYDISDYRAIDPRFGTMEDWENMLSEMHKRGLKLIMDLVVNHCSDQHKWFQEAKKSKDNPYRDYFIWKDPKPDGMPPNNWTSYFSGPAWEYEPLTNQDYLHLFSKEQPDLNWQNPRLREEIYDIMHYWIGKGVDGFRLDVMHAYGKTPGLPDGRMDGTLPVGAEHFSSLPLNHAYMKEMNREVFSKYDIFTVGETDGITIDDALQYTSEAAGEVNTVFQFQHVNIDSVYEERWLADSPLPVKAFKSCLADWQRGLDLEGWNSLYLSNHDQPRQVSRFGNDEKYWAESAKMLATIMHLQKGTPFVYQGEEIGMTNCPVHDINEVQDIESIHAYNEYLSLGLATREEMLAGISRRGRDNSRTPMQWDRTANAGFSENTPWLHVNKNYKEINVESQINCDDSIYHYYRKLINLRSQIPVVVYGSFTEFYRDSDSIFCFTRSLGNQVLLVTANMTAESVEYKVPGAVSYTKSSLYISNYPTGQSPQDCVLRPYEASAYLLLKH